MILAVRTATDPPANGYLSDYTPRRPPAQHCRVVTYIEACRHEYCITNASVSTQVPMRISCAITRRQLHHRDAAVPNFCSTVPPCVEKRIMWLRYFVQHLAVYGCASHRPIVPELHACIIAVSHYIGIYSCSVCWSFFLTMCWNVTLMSSTDCAAMMYACRRTR